MRKVRISHKIYSAASLIVLCSIIAILALAYVSVTPMSPRWDGNLTRIDEDYPRLDVSVYTNGSIKTHEYLIRLDEVPAGGELLAVWVVHREVRAYIGNEQVYDSSDIGHNRLSKSPGCYWILIPMDISDDGSLIRIEMADVYGSMLDAAPNMYLCTPDKLISYCLRREWGTITIGIACVMLCLIYVILAYLLHANREERAGVFCMGFFIGMFGLYRLLDMPLMTLVFNTRSRFITFLTLICYCWLPPLFYMSENRRNPSKKIYFIVCLVFSALESVFMLLQITGIADLRETVGYTFMFMLLSFAAVVSEHIYCRIRKGHMGEPVHSFVLYLTIALSSFGDFAVYYYSRHTRFSNFTLYVVLIYGLISGVDMIKKINNRNQLIIDQRLELADQRSALMLSQMQPHFVYNTMNTIYALCDTNIEDAKNAIHAFSGFLRHNLGSMDRKTPVPFETELEHIRFYLSIEKLRFGDELNVVYDINETGFKLPPISLQPIVENAVRHGIRHKTGGGTVTISTAVSEGMYTVKVTDDGAGFDTDTLTGSGADQEHNHIALRNVALRVEQMCGGHLDITSAPGAGTTVVISVPAKEDELR